MQSHIVRQGECLSLIAAKYGFRDYRTIYDHPANAAFKRKRKNPNLIHPGDEIKIPDLAPREASIATGASHRFTVKLPTKKLALLLRDAADEPVRDATYLLVIESVYYEGKTDGDGKLEQQIAVDAERGTLWAKGVSYDLAIGQLNPLHDAPDAGLSGAQGRMRNLGLGSPTAEGDPSRLDPHALAVFQLLHGLPPSCELDAKTMSKLEKEHGT